VKSTKYKSGEKDFLLKFGKNLKLHRVAKGFTQEKLALEIDVPLSQVARIELGEINTGVLSVNKIAIALKIHPKELFNF
jgi:transcriptional regulator with XRE-family HTH domain